MTMLLNFFQKRNDICYKRNNDDDKCCLIIRNIIHNF